MKSETFGMTLFGFVLVLGSSHSFADSQLDDLVKEMRPLSSINSNSEGRDYQVYPDTPRPMYTPRPIFVYPTLKGLPALNAANPSTRYGLDEGLPLSVFLMTVGSNRAEIEINMLRRQNVDDVITRFAANPNQPPSLYSSPPILAINARNAFELKNNYASNPIDPYSLKPRHTLSSKTLQKIDELHQLPFETKFLIYVERDTGAIVCKVLLSGRNIKFSLIQKGDSVESALTAGVVRMYRDRLVFLTEDLARNDRDGFNRTFLNSVGSNSGSSLLWSHVNGAGYVAQKLRSGFGSEHGSVGRTVQEIQALARYYGVTAEEAALLPLPATNDLIDADPEL